MRRHCVYAGQFIAATGTNGEFCGGINEKKIVTFNRLRMIKEVINELTDKGIRAHGAESHFYDYTDNEESPLKTLFDGFFQFG